MVLLVGQSFEDRSCFLGVSADVRHPHEVFRVVGRGCYGLALVFPLLDLLEELDYGPRHALDRCLPLFLLAQVLGERIQVSEDLLFDVFFKYVFVDLRER